MKRRYSILITLILVAAITVVALYSESHQYPVYTGEDLFSKEEFPYTFVFFGDSQPKKGAEQPEVFVEMVPKMNEENPLFVIGGGDFVCEGDPENFQAFLNIISALNAPLFYVCGNHDDSKYYEQYLGERVYAFTYKNSQFIILDNSNGLLNEKQLHFLEKQLKKGFENTFVFLHMPPFDPEDSQRMLNPEEFMEIVQKYDVDYVFCSHIHSFYEVKKGNTLFIISGGAGAPLTRGGYNHYLVVSVGESVSYKIVRCSA